MSFALTTVSGSQHDLMSPCPWLSDENGDMLVTECSSVKELIPFSEGVCSDGDNINYSNIECFKTFKRFNLLHESMLHRL